MWLLKWKCEWCERRRLHIAVLYDIMSILTQGFERYWKLLFRQNISNTFLLYVLFAALLLRIGIGFIKHSDLKEYDAVVERQEWKSWKLSLNGKSLFLVFFSLKYLKITLGHNLETIAKIAFGSSDLTSRVRRNKTKINNKVTHEACCTNCIAVILK